MAAPRRFGTKLWSQSLSFRQTAFADSSITSSIFRPLFHKQFSLQGAFLQSSFLCPRASFSGPLLSRTKTNTQQRYPQSSMATPDYLKRSSDIGFCQRQRFYKGGLDESYKVLKSSIQVSSWLSMHAVTAVLASRDGNRNKLSLAIMMLEQGLFRLAISDHDKPTHDRYILTAATMNHCKPLSLNEEFLSIKEDSATIEMPDRDMGLVIHFDPFHLDLVALKSEEVVLTFNSESKLVMEDFGRTQLFQYDEAHSEEFQDHIDPQDRGPESVGVDISFPSAEYLNGIPERTVSFSLPDTKSSNGEVLSEPYRMYNLDVCPYQLGNPIGLYGAVPFLYARRDSSVTGVFWNNASETLVDVQTTTTGACNNKSTHWFAESGLIDVFLLPGPSANDVYKQYLFLTGSTPLPPFFSLGYHQCRYSYENEKDVREVDAGFNSRSIPYDVMWLDIDHTDEKRYFTWDQEKYPDPAKLQEDLAKNGRRTVTIIDPHVKWDDSYFLHKLATKEGLYVKHPDGTDFVGECWAGKSGYLDFLSPRVRDEWGNLFNPHLYRGMTKHLYVWNDMNEPTVFDGPEQTMPKNLLHGGGIEHRHVHNIFGHSMARATYEGQLKNWPDRRPFVLTRSFFAGTQRYSTVWTADNSSTWGHLKSSVSMVSSLQICGMAMSGVDVGGFLGNPDGELAVRWYQAGAFQPFFRGHSNKGTKRREPWVFGEEMTRYIKHAIRARYEFLTYVYTLFASLLEDVGIANGGPPMRPAWWEFSGWKEDKKMWMLGDSLLIVPVMEQGVKRHEESIPNGRWYDLYGDYQEIRDKVDMEVGLGRMVVLVRGGKIVPRLISEVSSSADVMEGKFMLVIGLNEEEFAEGVGYFDDGISQGFRKGDYGVMKWKYEENTLKVEQAEGEFGWKAVVKKVMVCGYGQQAPKRVTIDSGHGAVEVRFSHNVANASLLAEGVDKAITEGDWVLHIEK